MKFTGSVKEVLAPILFRISCSLLLSTGPRGGLPGLFKFPGIKPLTMASRPDCTRSSLLTLPSRAFIPKLNPPPTTADPTLSGTFPCSSSGIFVKSPPALVTPPPIAAPPREAHGLSFILLFIYLLKSGIVASKIFSCAFPAAIPVTIPMGIDPGPVTGADSPAAPAPVKVGIILFAAP